MQEKYILNLIEKKAQRPLNFEEIVALLAIERKRDRELLQAQLDRLIEAGLLVKTRKERYGVPAQLNLVVGRVRKNKKGFGFLVSENPDADDIFIPSSSLAGSGNMDKVIVRLTKPATSDKEGNQYKAEGEVIRIIERYKTRFIGVFEKQDHFGFVRPHDKLFDGDIFIHEKNFRGARSGDRVVVDITKWPERKRSAEGKIIEVFGHDGDLGLDVLSIIYDHGLRTEFPKRVRQEAQTLNKPVENSDLHHRIDYRQLPLVTIDGDDTKDFDDAVYVEKNEDGTFHLGVHIADVAHYVTEESALDKEAFKRGTSVYLVDRVLPMLPEALSNGICSLNAGEDRLALSCIMTIDATGRIVNAQVVETVINVAERLTYHNVNRILEEEDEQLTNQYANLVPMLHEMQELHELLFANRQRRGMIEFEIPEVKVVLNKIGKPIDLKARERGVAERMIESFMVSANEVIAERYHVKGVPFLYRVHESPEKEKVLALKEYLYHYGITLPEKKGEVLPRDYAQLLNTLEDDPKQQVISMLMLRSMNHAYYSPVCDGHFGLASRFYTHFTSPIRRYSDLVIHRIIKELLKHPLGEKREETLRAFVASAAEQASSTERVAEEAERESVALKKVEYMEDKVGDIFEATITSVTGFGIFVQLDNLIEGLVHISSLVDDFYKFDVEHQRLIGEHKGDVFDLGKRVRVELVRVNLEEAQLDFELVNEEQDEETSHR